MAAQNDAGEDVLVLRLSSATCAEASLVEQMEGALQRNERIVCRLTDGGVGFSIPRHANPERRTAMAKAIIVARQIEQMSPGQQVSELQAMEREARTGAEHYTTAGMIFRAPDRTRGNLVVFEGTAENVHERGRQTILDVMLNPLSRETFYVILPRLADESVVSGARVRIYGIYVDSDPSTSPIGPPIVPSVYAVAIRTLAPPRDLHL